MGITFEQLQQANKQITTTDIKGKEYAEVNQRIKAFRMLYPNGCISTELLGVENGTCIIKATVKDDNGNILGTGTAYEKEGSTFINKTSYIENCETSAVGRALGMVGIGIDVSVASYEEVSNAIVQQNKGKKVTDKDINALRAKMKQKGIEADVILSRYKVNSFEDMTFEDFMRAMVGLDKSPDKEGE